MMPTFRLTLPVTVNSPDRSTGQPKLGNSSF